MSRPAEGARTGSFQPSHPAWAYARIVSGQGDSTTWECNFCGKVATSSGTRLFKHITQVGKDIAKCTGGPTAETKEKAREARVILLEWARAKDQPRCQAALKKKTLLRTDVKNSS